MEVGEWRSAGGPLCGGAGETSAAGVEPGGDAADVGAADVGPWPTLASDISIARGDVSLKTSPMGYGWEYHLLGKWMAEPIVDGAEEEETTA